jgi:hypothetical protein
VCVHTHTHTNIYSTHTHTYVRIYIGNFREAFRRSIADAIADSTSPKLSIEDRIEKVIILGVSAEHHNYCPPLAAHQALQLPPPPRGESSAGVLKVEFRVEAPEDEIIAVSQSLVDVVCVCVCVCVSIVYMCMYV